MHQKHGTVKAALHGNVLSGFYCTTVYKGTSLAYLMYHHQYSSPDSAIDSAQ